MAHPHVFRHPSERHRLAPFWHHFWQMFGVMAIGMVASAGVYVTALGLTWDEAVRQHPAASLVIIAAGMSIPMAAWMLHRGMGWRNAAEMAGAMALPVVPFLCLVWTGATASAQCGAYCLAGIAAMLGLMLYRRDQYSMEMAQG